MSCTIRCRATLSKFKIHATVDPVYNRSPRSTPRSCPALLNQSGSIPSLFAIPAFRGFAFPFEDQSRQRGEGIEPLRGREILEMSMAIEIRRFTGG
jgi:hypothetical protein